MQYRGPYSDVLSDRTPYPGIKQPEEGDSRIALAFGELGVVQLVQSVGDPSLSVDQLINSFDLLLRVISCQEKKTSAISNDIVGVIKEGLDEVWRITTYGDTGPKMVKARCLALNVLSSISKIEAGREAIIKESVVPILFGLLSDSRAEQRFAALQVVNVLSGFKSGRKALLAGEFPKSALLSALSDESSGGALQLCMLQSIANLTEMSTGIDLILECNALPIIIQILRGSNQNEKEESDEVEKDSTFRRKVLIATLQTVWNLSHDAKGNEMCVKEDSVAAICKSVAKILEKVPEWSIVERCASGGKVCISETSEGVDVLSALAAREDKSISTNAWQCMRMTAKYLPVGPRFVLSLLDQTKLLVDVFGVAALHHLGNLLNDNEGRSEIAELAADAIELITRNEEGQKAAQQVLYMEIGLARVLCNNKSNRAQRSAASALNCVCTGNSGKGCCRELNKAMKNGEIEGIKRVLASYPSLAKVITRTL